MPVFIAVVRICQCYICESQWGLDFEEKPPEKCIVCGTTDWEFGAESRDSKFIRQGISRLRKTLNPGAKSRGRQLWGKKQWQGFKSREQVEALKLKTVDTDEKPVED